MALLPGRWDIYSTAMLGKGKWGLTLLERFDNGIGGMMGDIISTLGDMWCLYEKFHREVLDKFMNLNPCRYP